MERLKLNNTNKGIILITASAFCFALMGMFVRPPVAQRTRIRELKKIFMYRMKTRTILLLLGLTVLSGAFLTSCKDSGKDIPILDVYKRQLFAVLLTVAGLPLSAQERSDTTYLFRFVADKDMFFTSRFIRQKVVFSMKCLRLKLCLVSGIYCLI